MLASLVSWLNCCISIALEASRFALLTNQIMQKLDPRLLDRESNWRIQFEIRISSEANGNRLKG